MAFSLLSANLWVATHGWTVSMIGPLWSISIEEQYYLVWPFIARYFHKRGLWLASGLLLLAAYGTLAYLGGDNAPRYQVWVNSFVQFQFFALGAIVALVLHKRTYAPSALGRTLMLLASFAFLTISSSHHITEDRVTSVQDLVLGYLCLACGVSMAFLSVYKLGLPSWCAPLLYLGRISYGLYVFHFLALQIGGLASSFDRVPLSYGFPRVLLNSSRLCFSLGLCILLAMLSHRYLERPFLRLKKPFCLHPNTDLLTVREHTYKTRSNLRLDSQRIISLGIRSFLR